jgi:nudix-type nucleoside diphosphatase (YffH/AdpP family)
MGRDGVWSEQDRDLLDRGDGITVLLCNRARRTVLLLMQPRVVATVRGKDSSETIEACNGQMEDETPLECALREVEQETGHRLTQLHAIGAVYASPGASLEIVHLFWGEYSESTKVSAGGGLAHEGEDIELLEASMDQAMRWIAEGVICDARTILTLQYAALNGIFE